MTTTTQELIGRLRSHVVDCYDGKNDTMRQAADRLSQLQAERDRQYDENVTLIMEKASLEAENDALWRDVLAVLEPFAEPSRVYDEVALQFGLHLPDDATRPRLAIITHGHIRAARALRDRLKGGQDG